MPIGSFISQPDVNGIAAAYRPVIIRVAATATDNLPKPPVVYCDVYFNDIYYKTIAKSQYTQLNVSNSEWQFDIQDAAQEFLKKVLGDNGESAIVEATTIITKCLCRFRSSGIDAAGFIQPEDTEPIQGTGETDPVAGTGTDSNVFYIVNATLQHEDIQSITSHLATFKKRTWAANTWPLSHRPDYYKLCQDDSDIFPILHDGNDLSCLVLNYQFIGQTTWNKTTNCAVQSCPIPDGFTISVLDNGDDTQTFTFNWGAVLSPTAQLDIQSRPAGSSDPWTSHIGSIIPTRNIVLPIGLYDFRYAGVGDCATKPSIVYPNQGIAVCIAVEITANRTGLPDAQAGLLYGWIVYLSGSAPFALANVIKPSWMSINIVGATVQISGTPAPGDAANNVPVSFDVTNCNGHDSDSVNTTINVISATPSTLTNNSGTTFGFKIRINGTFYAVGSIAPAQTINFSAPELALGSGYDLMVYTGALLMTTCTSTSFATNIPMKLGTGPSANVAVNLAMFTIHNGIQIVVT